MKVTQYISTLSHLSLLTEFHHKNSSHIHDKACSDWLPSYIMDVQPVPELLKMVEYFSVRRYNTEYHFRLWLWLLHYIRFWMTQRFYLQTAAEIRYYQLELNYWNNSNTVMRNEGCLIIKRTFLIAIFNQLPLNILIDFPPKAWMKSKLSKTVSEYLLLLF